MSPALLIVFQICIVISLLLFVVWLIIKIRAKRNWARVTFLVMFISGALTTPFILVAELQRDPFLGMVSLGQIGLQCFAVYLLFSKPASECFRGLKKSNGDRWSVNQLPIWEVKGSTKYSEFKGSTKYSEFMVSERVQRCVGTKHDKYLAKWRKILEKTGDFELGDPKAATILAGATSWNWAGFIFSLYWHVWRGLKYSGLVLTVWLLMIVAMSRVPISDTFLWLTVSVLSAGMHLAYGLYGNSWYLYTLAQRKADDVAEVQPSITILVAAIVLVTGFHLYFGIYGRFFYPLQI